MKRVLLPVMLVLAGLLAGCSSGSSSSSTPTLVSIAVTPVSPSISIGLTQQFKATGTYSNNTTQDLTATATWTSATTATATISSPGGLATAVAAGTTLITASMTGSTVNGSTTLTVTPVIVVPAITAIAITPVAPSVAAGLTLQFIATGTYSDGSIQVVTSTALWGSSNAAVATIAAGGLATTLIPGTTTISATVGSVTGSTVLTVGPAVLESIAVTPANDSVPVGTLTQFTATGTYSDGSTQILTSGVTWTSSNTATATISAAGVVTALAVDATPVTITATLGSMSGTAQLTVTTATLNSLTVTGAPSVTIADLTSYKFSAFGSYNDGSKRNITSSVTWTSSSTGVATISASGVATAVSAGTTTITATSGTATASVTLVVTSATVSSIVVAPSNLTLEPGTTQPFTAVGNFSDGSTQTITQNASWASSKTTVATIGNTSPNIGLATAVGAGTTAISAAFEGKTGSTFLHVNVATLKSITLTPATASMAVNSTLSLQCLGKYSDLKIQHIEPFASWTSSDTTVATVNGIGVVKGVAIGGPITITCAIGSVSATASITVEALTGITITPPSPSVAAGTSTNLAAIGTLTDSSTQDLTNTVEWTSSDTTVATVGSGSTSAGVVTGIAAGATTVTAAFSGQVAVTQVTVTAATLSSIAITPPDPIIALGASLQFVATGTFSDGSTENLLGQVTWTSSNNAVAIIDATGAISTTGKGTSTITATLDGVSDTTTLTVN